MVFPETLGCPDLNVSDACFKGYFFFPITPLDISSDLSVLPWEDKLCMYDCGHDSGRGNRQIASWSRLGRKLVFLPTVGCDIAYSITCKTIQGTSLVLQCLRLQAPSLGGPGSIPGQESRTTRPPNAETKNDPACLDQQRWRIPQP